jgi:hypothetical protein
MEHRTTGNLLKKKFTGANEARGVEWLQYSFTLRTHLEAKMNVCELVHAFAARSYGRNRYLFDSVEDLENTLLSDLSGFFPTDLAGPEIVSEVKEQFHRTLAKFKQRFRRTSRRYDRSVPIEVHPAPPVSLSPNFTPDNDIFFETLASNRLSQFEREALLAEVGLHPRFANFREFASAGELCCASVAYARRKRLLERLATEWNQN